MAGLVQYPAAGCIVEFFDASSTQLGVVIEESGDKLRLLLPNRRETKLPASRVLPWTGPQLAGFSSMGRDELVKALEAARDRRERETKEISAQDLWEMAQGEVGCAPAQWFAELYVSDPEPDTVAAYAHALLSARTRFRFNPPNFEVYSAEMAARRDAELAKQHEREQILAEGCPFVQTLWNVACGRCTLPAIGKAGWPRKEVEEKISHLLFVHMADPENQEEDALWKLLIKGLPEVPHLPVQLLMAWGKLPAHYNFWLDRAGYEAGDTWWKKFSAEVDDFVRLSCSGDLPESPLEFVSIDGETTKDVDDAFALQEHPDSSLTLTMAFACPGLVWPFGTVFDKAVLHRGTSIYLPEGDCHMLPEFIGTGALSLAEGTKRPALLIAQDVAADGHLLGECRISVEYVRVKANLRYAACQAVLDGTAPGDSLALPFAGLLALGHRFSEARLASRIADGAVILERADPKIILQGAGAETVVKLEPGEQARDAQNMVAEMMILASAALADWACARDIPLIFRSQDVALPKEYAGVWQQPQDVTRIMRAMVPSVLDTQPRPHAALGLDRYAPVTSPLRRYADLVNEAQVVSFLRSGKPHFAKSELDQLLLSLHIALEGAGQVQRFRPRYWKLLYFRQQGDRVWWPGVITEENDVFVSVSLAEQDIFVRGKRRFFDERSCPGMPVKLRLGKVNPLYNEIQIVEAVSCDGLAEEDS